jgi:hypothetical protein
VRPRCALIGGDSGRRGRVLRLTEGVHQQGQGLEVGESEQRAPRCHHPERIGGGPICPGQGKRAEEPGVGIEEADAGLTPTLVVPYAREALPAQRMERVRDGKDTAAIGVIRCCCRFSQMGKSKAR